MHRTESELKKKNMRPILRHDPPRIKIEKNGEIDFDVGNHLKQKMKIEPRIKMHEKKWERKQSVGERPCGVWMERTRHAMTLYKSRFFFVWRLTYGP